MPYNDGGSNVCKSSGTGTSYDAHFYRSAHSLVSGEGLTLTFKVDLTNTWYVLRIVISDTNGFYVEAYRRDAPTVRGSYNTWMPTGKSWRFHHCIYRGNAYVDSYAEYGTGGMSWTPNDWVDASYDALDRLTGVAPVSGWTGYTATYAYSPTGNLMSAAYNGVTWVYAYPNSGAGSVRPHAVSGLSNGNQTQRAVAAGTYVLTYNVENQLVRVAMRENGLLSWLLRDQLSSTAMTPTASAGITGKLRYKAYGETRYKYGAPSTKYCSTGRREESTIALCLRSA